MNQDAPPGGEDALQAWVDDRLDDAHHSEVEAWLARHPTEATRYAAYRAQRDQMRATLAAKAAEAVPPWLRPANLLRQRRAALRWNLGAVAAGVLLLALGGSGGWLARARLAAVEVGHPGRSGTLADAALSAHLTFVLEVRHPVEVPASQEAHLVAWLSNRLGRPLRVPDLAPLGFRLMGGRLLPGASGPAAQFMYSDDQGTRLTLYLRAEPDQGPTGFAVVEQAGVTGLRWVEAGFGYAVLAETGRDRLLDVAAAVDRQLPAAPAKAS